MSELTKNLHDIIYTNCIWPNDLLENLADPAYLKVQFQPHLDGLMAEVVFIDEGEQITTLYYFNKKQFLQRIEMIEGDKLSVLYDRLEQVAQILKTLDAENELESIKKMLIA